MDDWYNWRIFIAIYVILAVLMVLGGIIASVSNG